jgi:hypothetical protein
LVGALLLAWADMVHIQVVGAAAVDAAVMIAL